MLDAATLALDDRREIWLMIKRLSPRQRIDWLGWCCKQVNGPDGVAEVKVTEHTGTVHEVYMDLMLLDFVHHLDLLTAGNELVRRVRRL